VDEFHVGEVARDLLGDLAPEAGGGQDVGLVERVEDAFAAAGDLEADADDAADLVLGVEAGVDGAAALLGFPDLLGRGEVGAAGQLADEDEVDVADDLGFEVRAAEERREGPGGSDVGEEAEVFAEAEDGLLGAGPARGG
jgi:hypothetical protein